ncbi:MAG: acyl carrier protein [Candidatus Omnitrophica bacterium]|nr:acyl carrier protein [Candidatus Omnitrophota bacterium]
MDDIKETIRGIVAEILEIDSSKITDEGSFVKDFGMDSMLALEILASVEKKFRVVIPEEALTKLTSINATVKVVVELMQGKT